MRNRKRLSQRILPVHRTLQNLCLLSCRYRSLKPLFYRSVIRKILTVNIKVKETTYCICFVLSGRPFKQLYAKQYPPPGSILYHRFDIVPPPTFCEHFGSLSSGMVVIFSKCTLLG